MGSTYLFRQNLTEFECVMFIKDRNITYASQAWLEAPIYREKADVIKIASVRAFSIFIQAWRDTIERSHRSTLTAI